MTRPTICVPIDATAKKRLRQMAMRYDMTIAAYVRWIIKNHIARKQEVDESYAIPAARGAK